MMKRFLSGIACVALVSSLSAETKVGPGTVEADARAAFINADDGTDDANALGAGVNLLYTQAINENYTFGAGFGAGMPLNESEDNAAGMLLLVERGTAMSGTYFSFDKLNVTYKKGDEEAVIGRFVADTPLAGSHDHYRLNKNALQGVFATFKNKAPNLTFAGGYIQSFAGIDSQARNTDGSSSRGSFNAMSDAAFGVLGLGKDTIDDNGVLTVAGIYSDDMSALDAQGWLYYMGETNIAGAGEGALTAFYLDADYAGLELQNGIKTVLSAQIISLGFSSDFSDFSHMITGLKAEATNLPIQELEAELAVNQVSGDGMVLDAWGAYPEYAASSEIFLTGLSEATAIRLSGRYDLAKQLENSKATLDLISQDGDMVSLSPFPPTVASYSAQIVQAGFEYAMPEKNLLTKASLILGSGDNETTALILKATYTF